MATDYTYDPETLNPWLAGLASGAVAAILGTFLAFLLRSPDEVVANSVTVTIGALVIGLASGWLWRRLRATSNGLRIFRWAMVGGFVATVVAIAIVDQAALSRLIPYGTPVAIVLFATVGLLTPYFATMHWPVWVVAVPVVIALALAVGLFGRGNVPSGDVSLDDLSTTTQAPTAITPEGDTEPPTTAAPAADQVFTEFVIADDCPPTNCVATWTVPETLRGLDTHAVGFSEELTGSITPGEGFEFIIDLTTFTSDQDRRDEFVRDLFAADPIATFSSDSFVLPDAPDGEEVEMTVAGTMTVNSTPRMVQWEVVARKDGNVVSVTGELDVTLTEFGIDPPRFGFVQVEDEAHLEVLFQAIGR